MLKKQITRIQHEVILKQLEISRLESEQIHNYKESINDNLILGYKKQIEELEKLVIKTNIKLDNMYKSFTKNLHQTYAEEVIDKIYREILIRIPDEQAKMHYLPRLINKEISEEDLRKILLQSEEAKNIRQNFGL